MSSTSTDFNAARRRVGRRRRQGVPSSPAPVPLVLVSASYDPDGPRATLVFDRAVNIGAFDGTQVSVNDPLSQSATFDGGGGATLVGPATVEIALVPTDLPSGEVVTLSATAMTGIVASDDGGTWAGVDDLALPFP